MRISSRILVVGAIPIVIAATIALSAVLLSREADRARSGATLAATVYRTLLAAALSRNDYVHAPPDRREEPLRRFFSLTDQARSGLSRLSDIKLDVSGATAAAHDILRQYVDDMRLLVGVTAANDDRVATMAQRAAALIALTDQARERQHASNTDIINSLAEGDAKLRSARTIMDQAVTARLAVASVQSDLLALAADPAPDKQAAARRLLAFDGERMKRAASDLVAKIVNEKGETSDLITAEDTSVGTRLSALMAAFTAPDFAPSEAVRKTVAAVGARAEQLIKIYAASYRAFHEEAAQLLTYSVQAHDTDLAAQNVAIETLKLSNQASTALSRRDPATGEAILANSRGLAGTIAALPISPLIQSEMIDAFAKWRDGLQTTVTGLRQQNMLLTDMDQASDSVIKAARALDDNFSRNAERTARSMQAILIVGAVTGLLLGGAAAFFVARSITQPLARLQSRIIAIAHERGDGSAETDHIEEDGRRDELGDIARASNVFLREIARRERALRAAKDRADAALDNLRRTQAELVQAEKLASLGQLVAGVAHEINTPIGIALTTATTVDDEARRFAATMADGRVTRSGLDRLVDRVSEGARLLHANLARAADLIQSFKHVAADQVSGERRTFDVRQFLHELLTSLSPMLRKSGHETVIECPDGMQLDSYPGALSQVVTNLVINASLHGYAPGKPGTITVTAGMDAERVRLKVSDTGRGIAPDHQAKIFDPFFTTRRSEGSTGLGLHIVFNLVTSTLGGRIDLESAPGRGTCFTVELPRRPASGEAVVPVSEVAL